MKNFCPIQVINLRFQVNYLNPIKMNYYSKNIDVLLIRLKLMLENTDVGNLTCFRYEINIQQVKLYKNANS